MAFRSLMPFQWGTPAHRGSNGDPFSMLHREIERVFDDFYKGTPMRWPGTETEIDVKIDVSENDKELKVTAELPGVDEKNLDVTLVGDLLTLKGEKKVEQERKEENYHFVERSYGSFMRSLRLPFEAGDKDVKAEFAKGVLTVTVAKPADVQKASKKIAIKAGK